MYALEGIKVLDLTQYIAGPFCTKMMSDFGADVIKVEKPGTGDMARRYGPFPGDIPHPEKSGMFLYLNTNKRGITLNLKSRTGVEMFKELVKQADVLVESFSPRVMPSLGLDYETLSGINPGLVMTSISSFGQTGAYRDWKATELTMFALSGKMHSLGDPDREPLKYALNAFQYFTGQAGSLATTAAMMRAKKEGFGEYIEISILETMAGDVDNIVIRYDYSGDRGRRTTAKNYIMYPFGGFPCKDGFVCIQGLGRGEEWLPRLFTMIGMPELKDDPRFSTAESRAQHTDEFYALLYSWLIDHTKQEVFDASAAVRYPMAPVYTTEELVKNEHYNERGFFPSMEHPAAGALTYPGAPYKLSEAGFELRKPAPLLGQHNGEVYRELMGYTEKDLCLLRRNSII
jgi:crotonobetainyl-CoA:carnitine CoA-transferase CaiB-like acyl-CoA transferase